MFDNYLDDLIHYGLLVGAVIQLVALASVIFLPSEPKEDHTKSEQPAAEGGVSTKPNENCTSTKKSTKPIRRRKK